MRKQKKITFIFILLYLITIAIQAASSNTEVLTHTTSKKIKICTLNMNNIEGSELIKINTDLSKGINMNKCDIISFQGVLSSAFVDRLQVDLNHLNKETKWHKIISELVRNKEFYAILWK